MSTVTAIKSILMGIAAQGAVTVTIPNDSDLVREMGPIDMTRKVGPIELRIQTAPPGNAALPAPAATTAQPAPADAANPPAPADPATEPNGDEKANQPPPAELANQPTSVDAAAETPPARVESKVAPARAATPTPPAEETTPAAPPKTAKPAAPATVTSEMPLAETPRSETPVQKMGYAGLWYDHSGRSAIEITNCGEGLCGRIVWLKDSTHNSVCGTSIIGGVRKLGNVYDNGWIYDIERGRKFDVELKLLSESKLRVKGYAGTKWFSKTFVWHRAPSNLERCA